MFPNERHQQIVKRIDDIEADIFRLYNRLAQLRLELQREWKVLPGGNRWSEEEQQKAERS